MKHMKMISAAAALSMLGGVSMNAQNGGPEWSQTIERALGAHGINAKAVTDYQNGAETLHLTIDGKTVAERVAGNPGQGDYSSTVYVVLDGIESRMRYMFPVAGAVGSQMRPGGITASSRSTHQQARPVPGQYVYDPVRDWHSRSTLYTPDEVYEDIRDLDLLEIALENGVSRAVRVKLVDPSYASSIPMDAKLLLLRARVIDLQRGIVFEKPSSGSTAPAQPKVSRWLAYTQVNVQLIDDATGQIVWQDNLHDENYTSLSHNDPMEDCVKAIGSGVARALDRLYPSVAPRLSAYGSISALAASKKEKATAVYVDLGYDQELKPGDSLNVLMVKTVGENSGMTQIGTLTVSEVQGPRLSLCKVKKGDKDIYSALQAGQVLTVETAW